jgi:hypothetical protein
MSSWLDSVQVSKSAYTLQGCLLCEDCGEHRLAVAKNLHSEGVEDDGDSGTFPHGPYEDGGGDSDSAQFCIQGRGCRSVVEIAGRKIGCPILCPLTSDGADAVFESVMHHLVSPRKFEQEMGRLLNHLWGASFDGRLKRVLLPSSLPNLEKLVQRDFVLHHIVLADPGHLYMIGVRAPGQTHHLLRASVDDNGKLANLDVVDMPAELMLGEGVEKLLRQAAEDGAWD